MLAINKTQLRKATNESRTSLLRDMELFAYWGCLTLCRAALTVSHQSISSFPEISERTK